MNVFSYSYGIIMDRAINALGHGNNVVYGLNATEKSDPKGKLKLIGRLASNYTTNIGMHPSDSKDVITKIG